MPKFEFSQFGRCFGMRSMSQKCAKIWLKVCVCLMILSVLSITTATIMGAFELFSSCTAEQTLDVVGHMPCPAENVVNGSLSKESVITLASGFAGGLVSWMFSALVLDEGQRRSPSRNGDDSRDRKKALLMPLGILLLAGAMYGFMFLTTVDSPPAKIIGGIAAFIAAFFMFGSIRYWNTKLKSVPVPPIVSKNGVQRYQDRLIALKSRQHFLGAARIRAQMIERGNALELSKSESQLEAGEEACPICQTKLRPGKQSLVNLQCSHTVHESCHAGMIGYDCDKCPVCRTNLR